MDSVWTKELSVKRVMQKVAYCSLSPTLQATFSEHMPLPLYNNI